MIDIVYDYECALDSGIVTDAELDVDIPLRGIYNCTFTYDIRLVPDCNYLYNTDISYIMTDKADIECNIVIAYISNYDITNAIGVVDSYLTDVEYDIKCDTECDFVMSYDI